MSKQIQKTKKAEAENIAATQISTCFVPNEVITNMVEDTLGQATRRLYSFLDSLGLSPLDSCSCNPKLVRWGLKDITSTPPSLDPIGIVTNPPDDVEEVGGIRSSVSLNYYLTIPEPSGSFSGCYAPKSTQVIPNNTAYVVVMDTGVDPRGFNLQNHVRTSGGSLCGGNIFDTDLGIDITDYVSIQNMSSAEPIDWIGHGTHINGIIADVFNPNPRVNVKLRNVKVSKGQTDTIALFDYLCGLYYALEKGDKVDVINNSLGWYDTIPPDVMNPLLRQMHERKIVFVAGAGNIGVRQNSNSKLLFWPAAYSKVQVESLQNIGQEVVISVGAWDTNTNDLWGESNWGEYIDVVAPGVDIESSFLSSSGHEAARGSGTSMSAAFVSRLAAEVKSLQPDFNARKVKNEVIKAAGPPRNAQRNSTEVSVVDMDTRFPVFED